MARALRSSPARGLLLLLLFVPSLVSAPKSQTPPPSRLSKSDLPRLLQTAEGALKESDFARAARALERALEVEPHDPAVWFSLGYAYTGLDDNERAVAAYRKALELEPNLFEARLNLGILFVRTKRPEAAIDQLEKAIELKPDNARARLYDGEALVLAKASDRAEKQLREALRLDPSLIAAYQELGQLCLAQKRYAEARAIFADEAERDAQLAQATLGMALASEELKDWGAATRQFENYLAARPDDAQTRFQLARIYLQQGQNEKALEHLNNVHRTRPDLAGLAAALGDVYALTRRFSESEKFYRQALVVTPSNADLHRALAQTLLEQEKLSEAAAEFRAALKLDPASLEATKGLATSLYLGKRYEEAVPVLEAIARTPDPPAILFFELASAYDHLRALGEALGAYERFLGLSQGRAPDQEWQARQRVKLLRRQLRK